VHGWPRPITGNTRKQKEPREFYVNRFIQALIRLSLRWTPDSFVVAGLLTLLTFVLAITVAGFGLSATIESWGDSFWNLLAFTNQITLTLLLGYALANTPPVKRGLFRLAGRVRSARTAYMAACLITGVAALLSWGLGLIVAGIASRAIGETCRRRGVRIHYPLLVASAYSGFIVWHQGLSSTVGLTLATPGHFLEDTVGIVPFSETVGSIWSLGVMVVILATMPFVMTRLRPTRDEEIEEMPEHLMTVGDPPADKKPEPLTPAERIESSPILMGLMALLGLSFLYTHFIGRGDGLTLDIFNFAFLVAGLLLAGSMARYVRIIVQGGQVAAPFLLQYPFYAAIAGVMSASGLANMVVELFLAVSSEATLPFFGFLSSGLLNVFIPSAGGQWAVQGPIMMSAALELGADIPRTAMAVAIGDEWTNLIQPLGIVPVLAIAQIPLRKMIGYCFVALLYSGVVFSLALLLF
jgi:short-chain fatty acids transporter